MAWTIGDDRVRTDPMDSSRDEAAAGATAGAADQPMINSAAEEISSVRAEAQSTRSTELNVIMKEVDDGNRRDEAAAGATAGAAEETAAGAASVAAAVEDEISSVVVEVGASKGTTKKKLLEKPMQFKRKSAPEPRLKIECEENSDGVLRPSLLL